LTLTSRPDHHRSGDPIVVNRVGSFDTGSGETEPEPREAELVERFRRVRDGESFEQLYRLSRRRVLQVCLHFLRDPASAEDACHDAFVQAYERFETLRGDRFGAWVRRIAANHCLNLLRRRATGRRLEPALAATRVEAEASAHGRVAARQGLRIAAELLSELSPHQRRVFLLRHVDGSSHEEIERLTGFSAEQVRSFLQNARRNFRLGWAARTAGGSSESWESGHE
jgi:RNA polymerase sigma-70 factor (ECF subfamily)